MMTWHHTFIEGSIDGGVTSTYFIMVLYTLLHSYFVMSTPDRRATMRPLPCVEITKGVAEWCPIPQRAPCSAHQTLAPPLQEGPQLLSQRMNPSNACIDIPCDAGGSAAVPPIPALPLDVHPNDHVNRGQSSNDTIPTAM
jgi:hypothetical protein